MNKPLVSVRTITYNHAPFIRQCIEGVLMQKTNFQFEFIIGEDCSTDGTAEIVNEYAQKYPDVIKVITSEENVGAVENDGRTALACRGKYVAFCEGDDFWTDANKLQEQVDFLESHPDYGMVHSDYSNKIGKVTVKNVWKNKAIPQGNILPELVMKNVIVTPTVCMRRDLLEEIAITDLITKNNWSMGDYPLWLEVAGRMKIGFIAKDMATYRVHPNSASHGMDVKGNYKFFNDRFSIKKYYASKFNQTHLMPLLEQNYHMELLKFSIFMRDKELREKCVRYFTQSNSNRFFWWKLFAKYSILDQVFYVLYYFKQKFKLKESL